MTETINVGTTGTRVLISGIVESCKIWETQWGITTEVALRNTEGVRAHWMASKRLETAPGVDLEPGDPLTVRATIKGYARTKDGVLRVELTKGSVQSDMLAIV